MERYREHPHACVTLSEAGTWGSAEQDWSDSGSTEEPASEDNVIEESCAEEDLSFVIDGVWPIQGGTTDPELPPEEQPEAAEVVVAMNMATNMTISGVRINIQSESTRCFRRMHRFG